MVPAEPVVLAGCGPLLYLLGWQYVRAGVPIAALVDTTVAADYRRALPHLAGALAAWRQLKKGLAPDRARSSAPACPCTRARRAWRWKASDRATAFRFQAGGKQHRIATSTVLLHQGVVPNTQFTWSLRASHRWNDAQLCWQPQADAWGRLDVPGDLGGGRRLGHRRRGGGGACRASWRRSAPCTRWNASRRPSATAWRRPCCRSFAQRAAHPPFPRCPVPAQEGEPGSRRRRDRLPLRGSDRGGDPAGGRARLPGPQPGQGLRALRHGPLPGPPVRPDGDRADRRCARRSPPAEVGYYRVRPPIKPITFGELAGAAVLNRFFFQSKGSCMTTSSVSSPTPACPAWWSTTRWPTSPA